MREDVRGIFNDALRHHQVGQQVEAEQLFRMVLKSVPRHADSLYFLGLIAYQGGRYDIAAERIGQAIQIKQGNPSYHYTLGNALSAQGRIIDAVAQYERAVALKPDYAEAHNNLGIILAQQGRSKDAIAHYERALLTRPDYANAHSNLGVALVAQGRIADAIAHYERALVLRPDYPEAQYNLGFALMAQGRTADAIAIYERALALNPDHADLHNNLGVALVAQGRVEDAIAHYERALVLKPDYPDAHSNLGTALAGQGKMVDAMTHLHRALVLNPGHANAHSNLGRALAAQGQIVDAVSHLQRALVLNPDHAEAHNNLGSIFKAEGSFDDAMAHYGRAIAIKPDYGEAHLNRAEIKSFGHGDPDLAALETLAERHDLSANQALHIHFALAKALEDCGDYVRAFEHLRRGNALKRRQIKYDEVAVLKLFEHVSTLFDGNLFTRFQGEGDPSLVPVFVLGMPRSGSTLIEQILASHPQIHGAGELGDFDAAANSVFAAGDRSVGYPDSVSAMDGVVLRRIGQSYLARLAALADGKVRVVDKSPGNFLNIGLIRLTLPNARIIHTMRHPIDTCVSCYSKLFTHGQHYTYDLGELGRFYRSYSELMAHWRSVLPPGAMLDVSYEDIVDDLEGQARRLIEYCGLPWDDRCITFYSTSRTIKTASAVQVRKPLFRSSLQRWRHYQGYIGPLLHELKSVLPGQAWTQVPPEADKPDATLPSPRAV